MLSRRRSTSRTAPSVDVHRCPGTRARGNKIDHPAGMEAVVDARHVAIDTREASGGTISIGKHAPERLLPPLLALNVVACVYVPGNFPPLLLSELLHRLLLSLVGARKRTLEPTKQNGAQLRSTRGQEKAQKQTGVHNQGLEHPRTRTNPLRHTNKQEKMYRKSDPSGKGAMRAKGPFRSSPPSVVRPPQLTIFAAHRCTCPARCPHSVPAPPAQQRSREIVGCVRLANCSC